MNCSTILFCKSQISVQPHRCYYCWTTLERSLAPLNHGPICDILNSTEKNQEKNDKNS